MKFKGIFENIFGRKEEETQQEIQTIKKEKQEEKNKSLNKILSEELRKTERLNVRFSKYTLNLINEKVKKITKKENLTNSEIINFVISYFLSGELIKEPIKITSRNTKKYKLSFEFSKEEIKYLFNTCIEKNIDIKQSCYQLTRNGIGKEAKNQIYKLLMSEIHGLSNTQEEKKFIENIKELKEINRRIVELKNYEFYNLINQEDLKNKYEEILKKIAEMSENIKQITKFLKAI